MKKYRSQSRFGIYSVLFFLFVSLEFSLLYAINNNPFTEIHKISLEDGIHTDGTALVSWRRVGDFIGLDYDYQQNRLYWADSFSIYRSFLGNGKQNIFT